MIGRDLDYGFHDHNGIDGNDPPNDDDDYNLDDYDHDYDLDHDDHGPAHADYDDQAE